MVLKELLSLWHDESALKEIFHRFDDMLLGAKDMFSLSTSYLTDGAEANLRKNIVKMDSHLNTLQQVIRRDIITHISVHGTSDVVPCLLLMSLTKDAERIGDYCKNIQEMMERSPQLKSDPLRPDLLDMRAKILIWFDQTKRAFDRNDRDLAKSTREEAFLHEKECDRLVWELAADNGGRNAVAMAITIRFFKRVAAHLGNICTSVIMPIDKLDYFEES